MSIPQRRGGGDADGCRINVNDPGLITLVNKLQDVFTTVGVRISTRQEEKAQEREPSNKTDHTRYRSKTPSTSPRSPW